MVKDPKAPLSGKGRAEPPDVERHDEVYFRHTSGPKVGRVLARGSHGCTIEADGARHKVKWENFLGHKVRVRPDVKVVDQGEDGLLVEDSTGRRRFVQDPMGAIDATGEMHKSLRPTILLFGRREDMFKALKGSPGLTLRDTTDKTGKRTKRWVRANKDAPKVRPKAAVHAPAGAAAGYGTHNLGEGDKVNFKAGDFEGEGTITGAPGKDGAHVVDSSGRAHQVHWNEIRGHTSKDGTEKPAVEPDVRGDRETVPPDKFKAAAFASEHDDPDVSAESILKGFPADTKERMAAVQERLATIEETIAEHKTGDAYLPARQAKHREIYAKLLSPERIAAATPADGPPTFTILGGRGGSGKSWFKNKVYDPAKSVVIDSDEIKGMLPEYEGWNAHQVHEESSDIANTLISTARLLGLNVVLDGTLKSSKGAVEKVKAFKGEGYRVEAHYMHLPRQEAAKRAVSRFLGKTQRYVPVEVVLANTTNEASFDEVRAHADAWSFRDNNVAEGEEPILISEHKT